MVDIAVVYRSVDNCPHVFVTGYFNSNTIYPSNFIHECPRCRKTHGFRPREAFIVNTPLKKKMFEEQCRAQNITESNVDVSTKKK